MPDRRPGELDVLERAVDIGRVDDEDRDPERAQLGDRVGRREPKLPPAMTRSRRGRRSSRYRRPRRWRRTGSGAGLGRVVAMSSALATTRSPAPMANRISVAAGVSDDDLLRFGRELDGGPFVIGQGDAGRPGPASGWGRRAWRRPRRSSGRRLGATLGDAPVAEQAPTRTRTSDSRQPSTSCGWTDAREVDTSETPPIERDARGVARNRETPRFDGRREGPNRWIARSCLPFSRRFEQCTVGPATGLPPPGGRSP